MDVLVRASTWRGVPAWLLESTALRVVLLPGLGAKIVSIFDRRAGYEWLVGPGSRPLRPVSYAAVFVDQDMSGWDEMFPTIDACSYPVEGAYGGRQLPDHGEAWTLCWETDRADHGCVTMSSRGKALPYRLERTVSFMEVDRLKLSYILTNLGEQPFIYLWAAHPQFTGLASARVVLPPEVCQVVNVMNHPVWGAPGTRYTWPEATTPDGTTWRLDHCRPVTHHACRKFYIPPETPIGWAGIEDPQSGCSIHLEWDPLQVPYLGIWVDEGVYNTAPTIALEPSTAYYDSLALAYQLGLYPVLAPGEHREWSLTVSCRGID
jgi:galactose mutarotase-like enzyme